MKWSYIYSIREDNRKKHILNRYTRLLQKYSTYRDIQPISRQQKKIIEYIMTDIYDIEEIKYPYFKITTNTHINDYHTYTYTI